MFDEILSAVLALASQGTNLFSPIAIGSLPSSNSISAFLGPGAGSEEDLIRNAKHELVIVFNAKNADQRAAVAALSKIIGKLTQMQSYPSGSTWTIANISTGMTPSYTGQEEKGQWIYTMSVKALVYLRGA